MAQFTGTVKNFLRYIAGAATTLPTASDADVVRSKAIIMGDHDELLLFVNYTEGTTPGAVIKGWWWNETEGAGGAWFEETLAAYTFTGTGKILIRVPRATRYFYVTAPTLDTNGIIQIQYAVQRIRAI